MALTTDQKDEIVYLRGQGESLASIGAKFGVSRERIRQIVGDRVLTTDLIAVRHARIQQVIVDCDFDLIEAARRLGSRSEYLNRLLSDEDKAKARRRRVRRTFRNDWTVNHVSDEDVFAALAKAADGAPLAAAAYQQMVDEGVITGGISVPRIFQRYGSWKNVCALAGIEPGGTGTGAYTSHWTDEELEGWVLAFLNDDSCHPHPFKGYETWARVNGAPSGGTVRNRLGRWYDLRERLLNA